MKRTALVFERSRSGHREAYSEYFTKMLNGADPLFGLNAHNLWKLIKAEIVIFSTADDYFMFYIALSLVRALMHKSSLGVLIRAEICLDRVDWKRILKKKLLQLQQFLGVGKSVTIMPFFVEPRLAEFVSGWIYDPAFFARNKSTYITPSEREQTFLDEVREAKTQGKRLALFMGALSEERGIREFLQLAVNANSVSMKFTFVACGARSANLSHDEIDAFLAAGGKIFQERVSEAVFDALFRMADCVWCVFRQSYDQFSGIFCNAVRHSIPLLVRNNSRLYTFLASLPGGVSFRTDEDELYALSDGDERRLIRPLASSLQEMDEHNMKMVEVARL